ncbi:hypothetical protein [Kribbella italica]|uniref:Uncharacterized protein n=1 Tax=Kribbella italica TaxID=1540520 RepID=A0A7W9J235_9ACTN|nr:hypothetical protein [Kribbella italica]MBB5834247.1 hypothetical protein [Kribbella italica]
MKRTARLDTVRAHDPATRVPLTLDPRAEADLQRIVGGPVDSLDEAWQPAPVRRSRRRPAVAFAAGGALVAGFAVAVPLMGGGETTSPAYAVTKADDGAITVTIYREEDAEGLERRLAEAGVRAEVAYLRPGWRCERTPQGIGPEGETHFAITAPVNGQPRNGISYTFKSAEYKDYTLMIGRPVLPPDTAEKRQYGPLGMSFLKTGTFGPCVQKAIGNR